MADDFFLQIGIKTQDLVGGLAGGVVNAFVFRQTNPVAIVGSVVVGCLTAAYLSETASHYLGTTGGATAFLVGLCAMAICQAIIAAVAKWKPSSNGSSNG
jgi:hypothetical protein